jgi:hypothetical protein
MKAVYGLVHTVAALGFIGLTAAATIVMAGTQGDGSAAGLVIAGLAAFVAFCCLQALSGAYVLGPKLCLLPQRPEDRDPLHPRFGAVHAWLSRPASLTLLGRASICLELASFFLVAAGPVLITILEVAHGGPCSTCTADDPRGSLPA